MVSTPLIFAGDEIGLLGETADSARRTMPWRECSMAPAGDDGLLAFVRSLIALQRNHAALCHGGLRWLGAWRDAVLYERATAEERSICLVARSGADLALSPLHPASWQPLIDGPSVRGSGLHVTPESSVGIWQA
jgi:alpha-glucosidase